MNNGYVSNNVTYPANSNYMQNNNYTDIYSEQSYIENILRMNKGKMGKFYCTFPDSNDWRDSIFNGIVEQAGRDHLIISNPNTGKTYIILMIYLNYVEFDGSVNYNLDFN